MRKLITLLVFSAFALTITTTASSCFMFRRKGKPQYRQAPPPKTTSTSYNRKGVKTKVKYRNYKNQYRSDYKGYRGGRDPYHYRNSRFKY